MTELRKAPIKAASSTTVEKTVVHLAKSLGRDGAAAMCGVFDLPAKAVTTNRTKVTCGLCTETAKHLMAGKVPANSE